MAVCHHQLSFLSVTSKQTPKKYFPLSTSSFFLIIGKRKKTKKKLARWESLNFLCSSYTCKLMSHFTRRQHSEKETASAERGGRLGCHVICKELIFPCAVNWIFCLSHPSAHFCFMYKRLSHTWSSSFLNLFRQVILPFLVIVYLFIAPYFRFWEIHAQFSKLLQYLKPYV